MYQNKTFPWTFAIVAGFALLGLATTLIARALGPAKGGETLAFSGVISIDGAPATGLFDVTFTFKKGGADACAPTVKVNALSTGTFLANIPLGQCPDDLFNGGGVLVDLSVGNKLVATDQPVSPVPHAKFADVAGSFSGPGRLCRALASGGEDLGYYLGDGLTYDPDTQTIIRRFPAARTYYSEQDCSGAIVVKAAHRMFANARYVSDEGVLLTPVGRPARRSAYSYRLGNACSSISREATLQEVADEGLGTIQVYDSFDVRIACD